MQADGFPESQGGVESQAQPDTQSTQQASQVPSTLPDGHLWGCLQPCNVALLRIDFWRINHCYRIGRNRQENEIILPGFKVSNKHCTITWDGKEDRSSAVTITDLSSNGTFINGVKIGKGKTYLLREGNEVAFGNSTPQHQNSGVEDYRFIYRHLAAGPATEGLYAQYDISSELGKGSFATVMKAIHRETGKWYAVKMIHDTKMAKPADAHNGAANGNNRATTFAREISILEKLKHPNICQLKEVFFQDGNINLVLELVEGGDLLDHILRKNGLKEDETRHIAYQICEALAYIHSKGIAHRDLKPENVLLTRDVPPVVKVADFGLAKVVDSLTRLKTMCGTPSYLAPEVVLQTNQEGYDNVVDSWSVGVIVFSMLTNASPFIEDDNQRDIRTRIAERQIDWTNLEIANVSEEAQSFIRRLLEVQPAHRMTLTAACSHPWLSSYRPAYVPRAMTRSPSPETPSVNVSMVSALDDDSFLSPIEGEDAGVSQSLQRMNLQTKNGNLPDDAAMAEANGEGSTTPPLGTTNDDGLTIRRDGSRTAPLRRRSHVLSQIADGANEVVPEPSLEMLFNAGAIYGTGCVEGNTTRGNKRMHSELTPLPEEMEGSEGDIPMNGNHQPLGDANANGLSGSPAKKKGKAAVEDGDAFIAAGGASSSRGSVRGRKPGAASAPPSTRSQRSRAIQVMQNEDAVNGDDAGGSTKPRRSSRQTPQKIARRA